MAPENTNAQPLERLELFFGQANDVEARIYAQYPGTGIPDEHLLGTIYGPHCQYAQTLPAKISFRPLGAGPTLLAEAHIPDPCFWTPAEPFYYTVHIELRRGSQVISHEERLFGIRPLATTKRNLVLKSRRWVMRGVHRGSRSETLADWHAAPAVMIVENPSDELCREASTTGVLLVALLEPVEATADELARLSRWPSVGMVVLPHETDATQIGAAPRNLLLAVRYTPLQVFAPPAWAHVVICEVDAPANFAQQTAHAELPVMAWRAVAAECSLTEARAACDALQRDLAPFGDTAGYLV